MKENKIKYKPINKQENKIKIDSLDIDKAEYREIVLSNSNSSDKDYYFKRDYYSKYN
jgi:hypothetical protein